MIQITHRERLLSIGLAAAIVVWGLYAMVVKPTRARIRTLHRIIPEKEAERQALQAASDEYLSLRSEFEILRARMASQQSDFQPLPFFEVMIERHKLAGHVVTMEQDVLQSQPNYSEVVVAIELQDVTLRQLIDFLVAVETSDAVCQVGSLHIRRDRANEGLVDSTVSIFCPRLQEAATEAQVARN